MQKVIKPLDFHGKHILVTGAASGIGRATAVMLSKLGADLILVDLNKEGLEQVVQEVKPSDCLLPLDLSDTKALVAGVEQAVKNTGPIDGVALVAGMLYTAPLKYVKEEIWEKIEKVNLYSAIELSKLYAQKGVRPASGGILSWFLPIADK